MSPERIRPGSAGAPPRPPSPQPAVEEEPGDEAPVVESTPPPPAVPPPLTGDGPGGNGERGRPVAMPISPRRHGPFRRLYYGETKFDFVRRRNRWFAISSLVILIGVISLATRGLNLDIEFTGGDAWIVQTSTVSVQQARTALTPLGLGGATITSLGTPQKTLEVQAKLLKGQGATAQNRLADQVSAVLGRLAHVNPASVNVEQVGPSWGSQITNKAIEALIVFFILVSLYISIFFEWRMALAAIIAVLHDIIVTVGIYSLSGFDVTPDTVVAFLTILGYSLYDTIVVFDRIRDNTRHLANRDRMSFDDLVNLSMNQTLARSLNTSLVAIMPILSVLVLGAFILGATTLEYFGLALLIGLTTGAYSSIFIASPLVAVMKAREPRYQQLNERLRVRGVDRVLVSPAAVAAGVLATDAYSGRRQSGTAAREARRSDIEPDFADEEAPDEGVPGPQVPARPSARSANRPYQTRPPAKRRRKGGRR